MSQLTDEQLQNTNSVIANGLEAKKMRHKIENKDLLSQKGALYVGTGNTTSTGAAVTTSIAPNSETDDGKVLIANSTANEGWQIGKITASNIEDGAVSPTKLNLQSDYAVKTLTVHATDSLDEQFAKYTNTGIEYAGINDSFNTLVYPTELPDTTGTVATKEQIENGDIIAKGARIAQYASEDTSKGTIEERLTSLGFRTGSLEILADNSGRKPSVDLNLIRKEGNVVTIYYSGEKGRASLDSSSLRQDIVGKIPSEFWPSTASIQEITELSSVASNLSLLKFNNEWYLQSSSTTANINEIFAYNLKQESSIDEIQLEYLPEISVPEGVDKTVVTRSLANATDWDLIENIPYVLDANSNNVVVSYDKDTSQKHNAYSGTVPDSTYDTSAYTGSGFCLASAGSPAGYYVSLYVKWNKTNKTVTYILSKYNRITPTKEGVATAKLSAFATNAKTLCLRGWHIFV